MEEFVEDGMGQRAPRPRIQLHCVVSKNCPMETERRSEDDLVTNLQDI
jgi:hypothetical protein